jgi:hypothetical protein
LGGYDKYISFALEKPAWLGKRREGGSRQFYNAPLKFLIPEMSIISQPNRSPITGVAIGNIRK